MGVTKHSPGCNCCGCGVCQDAYEWSGTVALETEYPVTGATITTPDLPLEELSKTSGTDSVGFYCETTLYSPGTIYSTAGGNRRFVWGSQCFTVDCSNPSFPDPIWHSFRFVVTGLVVRIRWYASAVTRVRYDYSIGWAWNNCSGPAFLGTSCAGKVITDICLSDADSTDNHTFYHYSGYELTSSTLAQEYFVNLGAIGCDEFSLTGNTISENGTGLPFDANLGPLQPRPRWQTNGCSQAAPPHPIETVAYDLNITRV